MATIAHSSPLFPCLPPTSILCLLQVVGGEKSVYYRDFAACIETRNAISYALTDVVEVGRFATNDASEYDDGIVSAVQRHLVGTVNKLKTARNGFHVNVSGIAPCFSSVFTAPSRSAPRLFLDSIQIPRCRAHIAGIGYGSEVVI